MRASVLICAAALLCSVSTTVLADDWVAERLRGSVVQLQGGQWVSMQRGDVIPDARKIRTGADGRLDLVRGQERISLVANTEIAIQDAAGQKMTSVVQSFGSVSIEAERRNVQHFSVQTPVLAAVVKGTKFTVTYANGEASVSVDRGVVQVQDTVHNMVADVQRGQSAEVSVAAPLDVNGPGSNRTVFLIDGQAVPASQRDAVLGGQAIVVPGETVARPGQAMPAGSNGAGKADAGAGVGINSGAGASVNAAGGGNGSAGAGVSVGAGASVGSSAGTNVSAGGGVVVQAGATGVGAAVGAGSGGQGNGVAAEVTAPGLGVSTGAGAGGVGVSVDLGGAGLGLSLGNSGNSGSSGSGGGGSSGSGSSGNSGHGGGNSGNSGQSNSGSGSGTIVEVNVLGLGLRL